MRLTILGASPACPNPSGASSGYLIEGPEGRLMVDCGHGVAGFVQTVTALDEISAIVISHMHPDHFFDLYPLKYGLSFTHTPPIPLYLPPDGRQTLDVLRDALELPASFWSDAYDIREYDVAQPLTLAGLTIHMAPTRHFIPAYAMRFSAPDSGVLAYSSDTRPAPDVRELMTGASLALVEATLPSSAAGVSDGHMKASEAGSLGRKAGVGRLVVTHVWHAIAAAIVAEAGAAFGRPVELALQGQTYEI